MDLLFSHWQLIQWEFQVGEFQVIEKSFQVCFRTTSSSLNNAYDQ